MGVSQIAWVLDEVRGLESRERLVLLALADRADERDECWPSKADIERRTELSRSSVQRALRSLTEKNLLMVKICAKGHRSGAKTNLYKLNRRGGQSDPLSLERGVTRDPQGGSYRPKRGVTRDPQTIIKEPSLNRGVQSNHVSVDGEELIRSLIERGILPAEEW